MAAAVMLAASVASAGQGRATAAGRVEISVDEGGVKPEIHIWINGKEVKPGDVIDLGGLRIEGDVDLKDMRPERGAPQAFLGVMVGPAEGKAGGEGGARINSVMPDSPAADAGLAEGDVITGVDDTPVSGPQQFVELVRGHKPGDRLIIKWTRDGKPMEKRVTLGTFPERGPASPRREEARGQARPAEAWLGVAAAPLTEEVAKIAGTDKGVLINSLTDESPAAKAGLLPGDVITAIDGKAVGGPGDLMDLIRGHKPGDTLRIDYYRSGKSHTAEVRLGARPAEQRLREGGRFFEVPEGLGEQVPELRHYMDQLRRWFEEGRANRGQQPPGRIPNIPMPVPMPETPRYPQWPHVMPLPPEAPRLRAEPYDVGKDVGQILERLDRIDKRLSDIERRLDRLEKKPER
jgi:hypothetical protein